MTIKTLTSAKALRRQMDDVRQRGYAIEMGENEDGLMCIGVPFLDGAGYPIAAMSLSAPERRMKPEVTVHAVEALKSAARRISIKLVRATRTVRLARPARRFRERGDVHAGCSVRRNCLSLTRNFPITSVT